MVFTRSRILYLWSSLFLLRTIAAELIKKGGNGGVRLLQLLYDLDVA